MSNEPLEQHIIREVYAERDKALAELLEKCKDQLECFEFFLRSDGLPKRHEEVKELLADIATLMGSDMGHTHACDPEGRECCTCVLSDICRDIREAMGELGGESMSKRSDKIGGSEKSRRPVSYRKRGSMNTDKYIRLKVDGESFWAFRYPDIPENQAEINNHLLTNTYSFGDRVEFDADRNVVRIVKTRAEVEEEQKGGGA